MSLKEIKVPDIGDFDEVPIIELFVSVGDTIKVDDAICTLESDKATMDVPADAAGVVKEVLVAVGDKVAEGTVLVKVEAAAGAAEAPAAAAPAPARAAIPPPSAPPTSASRPSSSSATPPSAACVSTSAAFPPRPCCTWLRSWTKPST